MNGRGDPTIRSGIAKKDHMPRPHFFGGHVHIVLDRQFAPQVFASTRPEMLRDDDSPRRRRPRSRACPSLTHKNELQNARRSDPADSASSFARRSATPQSTGRIREAPSALHAEEISHRQQPLHGRSQRKSLLSQLHAIGRLTLDAKHRHVLGRDCCHVVFQVGRDGRFSCCCRNTCPMHMAEAVRRTRPQPNSGHELSVNGRGLRQRCREEIATSGSGRYISMHEK